MNLGPMNTTEHQVDGYVALEAIGVNENFEWSRLEEFDDQDALLSDFRREARIANGAQSNDIEAAGRNV